MTLDLEIRKLIKSVFDSGKKLSEIANRKSARELVKGNRCSRRTNSRVI